MFSPLLFHFPFRIAWDQHLLAVYRAGRPESADPFIHIGLELVRRPESIYPHSAKEMAQALPYRPDVIMLDNFALEDLRRAVAMAEGRVLLEASGGVDLSTVRAIAETGVDMISVGALTHSAPVLDIGLDAN